MEESRKDKEKQFKRDYIVEKATNLFLEHGFEKTTMSDIAKDSDFAKGTLYLYFKNKEDIIKEIKKNIFEIFLVKMKNIVESKISVREKFTNLLGIYKKDFFYKVEKFGLKEFFTNLTETCKINKDDNLEQNDNTSRIFQITSELFNLDVKLIKEGKRDGFVNSKVNPELTAFLIESLMLGSSINIVAYENNLMKEHNLSINKILNGSLEFIISSITNKSF